MKLSSVFIAIVSVILLAFWRKIRIYLFNLNGTVILFKTCLVTLDYELLLWNKKHVVFITNYNHLGIEHGVVNKAIL